MESTQDELNIPNEDDFEEEFRKYNEELSIFNFTTEPIDSFNITDEFDDFALISIYNKLHNGGQKIYLNLIKAIEKITSYDNSLISVITVLKSLTFISVEVGENPYLIKAEISNTCDILNKAYQNLTECILTSQCLFEIRNELTDILHNIISMLQRVEIRIESQLNSYCWDVWKELLISEHEIVYGYLIAHRYNGTNELIAELYIQTLREATSDSIRMLQELLEFLKNVMRRSNKEVQLKLKKMIYNTNAVLENFELELIKPKSDIILVIQDATRKIALHLSTVVKYLLFDIKITDMKELVNLKELGHYIGTTNIISIKRYNRRIKF